MEMRKGPWSQQEDLQLVRIVGLFGDRRWDFIAKVSGLNRTGKSCRLRWVNYLHPDLKRGRITPQEERLILELHSRLGNRWSRIARKLPGRTDNEIKNYWRTHMRKKAQERKRKPCPSSPSSSLTYISAAQSELPSEVVAESSSTSALGETSDDVVEGYSMDQIWNEIAMRDMISGLSSGECKDEAYDGMLCSAIPSPMWEYCSYPLWKMDDEDFQAYH
ncbi:Myb-related protein [Musa troglodytarum]|uniref:Myb-related protein n=1 Tax=Musa troglodytarum TaxID=320322 RepID=A0A9E7HID5_9LILI|nr:Myb-related protein [Musa troglodytarum]